MEHYTALFVTLPPYCSGRGLAPRGRVGGAAGALPLLATYQLRARRRRRARRLDRRHLRAAAAGARPGHRAPGGRGLPVPRQVSLILSCISGQSHKKLTFSSRYLTLTPEEFRRGPMVSGLLTEDEADSILFALLRPDTALPDHLAPLRRTMSQPRHRLGKLELQIDLLVLVLLDRCSAVSYKVNEIFAVSQRSVKVPIFLQ